MQKMNWLMRVIYKWQKRKMCKCSSPLFEVKRNILCCRNCEKPIHKFDVVID